MRDRLIELLEDTLKEWECDVSDKTISEIAEHLIDNGVIVPPCKVGDTIYYLPKHLKDWLYDDVEDIRIEKDGFCIKTVAGFYFDEGDFGKTVFLTREEAGKALKEWQSILIEKKHLK